MFRDETQRARVCHILLNMLGPSIGDYWTDVGPTERAKNMLDCESRFLDPQVEIMFLLAWSIWNDDATLSFSALNKLDPDKQQSIGELIVAKADNNPPDALDKWIETYSQ